MNVMRSPKICRALLELILPNEEIGAIRLKKSDNPLIDNSEIDEGADENLSVETQKTLKLEAECTRCAIQCLRCKFKTLGRY